MADIILEIQNTTNGKTEEVVISKIKEMISNGTLKPGDRLPAERKMALDFGVGRAQVREALHKL